MENKEQKVNSTDIVISNQKYDALLRALSLFRNVCNDVDIRNGIIRQRSNDNASIIQLDLRSIIGEVSLPIAYIKSKLDMIKMFAGDNDVTISVNTKNYEFRDQYSSLKFTCPDLDYLDNHFLSKEEQDKLFIIDEDNMLVSFQLSKLITERMRIVSEGFNVNTFNVIMDGETSSIQADSKAKDQGAVFVKGVTNCKILNGETSLVVFPFVIDHDHELEFKIYDLDKFLINMYTCKISDLDVTIYTRSKFTE